MGPSCPATRLLAAVLLGTAGCPAPSGERAPAPAATAPADARPPARAAASSGDAAAVDAAVVAEPGEGYPLHALALFHQVNVYAEPSARADRLGVIRRGSRVRAGREVEGRGCREGRWHPVAGGGFVCSGRTMRVEASPPEVGFTPTPPDVDAPSPYEYGVNHAEGVPLYRRLPSRGEMRAEEERRLRLLAAKASPAAPPPDGGPPAAEAEPAAEAPAEAEADAGAEEEEEPTGPIVTRLGRGFYVTIDAIVSHEGRQWVRTAALNYVAADGVSRRRVPEIHGAELGEALSLPLAMVYKDGARTVRPGARGRFEAARELERFDVVPVVGTASVRGEPHYATGQGDFVSADRVRLIEARDPPPDLGPDERWLDVDLGRQTLVAYEGSRPVYATLVATGKPRFDTPPGDYRLLSKHISASMSDDPDGDDPYLIEDVPWTMYFQGAFALHGAFWHSRFGQVRSHGCVNLAPADARWLFYWVGPSLPEGWHGVFATADNPGTRLLIHD